MKKYTNLNGTEIAVIGMAGRFPGACNVNEFWRNLRDGVESIRALNDQELEAIGVDAKASPGYVNMAAIPENIEFFDAAFFGYTPRDAELMDPQHRLFLECAWEAFESAGYDPESYKGAVAVFAGSVLSSYLLYNLLPNRQSFAGVDPVQVIMGNSGNFLSTRVSYNLNLKGPSVTVQSACSTSLVAVHMACQNLLNNECDMALGGGVTVNVQYSHGYHHIEGDMNSVDGHCRSFDAQASGTIFGCGAGAVVLKRLEDAINDGDCIRAVIKGSAINNDGAVRVGYTAPGIEGQTAVIAEALAVSEVDADTIDYIEGHGAATKMGDAIEIQALKKAFKLTSDATHRCALGSVKTNVGHLAAAAGVTGLIKTILALENKLIPPSLYFKHPNPDSGLANSHFFVNSELKEWSPTNGRPRRAGVSSFGLGGTNAHVVLEESPVLEASGPSRPCHLLVLSTRTETALETASLNLANHFRQTPGLNIADAAYTLQTGRKAFNHRRMMVCSGLNDAAKVLDTGDPQRLLSAVSEFKNRPVVFLFPGMGDQYVNMGLGLYQTEPAFRASVDHCAAILEPLLGLDIRKIVYPEGTSKKTTIEPGMQLDLRKLLRRGDEPPDSATRKLSRTELAHPVIFTIEYALTQLWMEWGIHPQAMIGHSIGEYIAACLAGVFSLEDALLLVTTRAQMIQKLPGGAMLAVLLSEENVQPFLNEHLSLSAINAPCSCVISGSDEAVAGLQQQLLEQGKVSQRLQTTHAFHSKMMEPLVEPFIEQVKRITLKAPEIPFLSNVTGDWVTEVEVADPSYWAKHLCQTVRFADGIRQLLKEPEQILLEIGPGLTLSTLTAQRPDKAAEQVVLTSLRHPHNQQSDSAFLLTTLGRLWMAGVDVNWAGFYAHEQRNRLPLPSYPFERQRYWIEGQASSQEPAHSSRMEKGKNRNIADWFFTPAWQQTPSLPYSDFTDATHSWLVFIDSHSFGTALVERLRDLHQQVVTVEAGDTFGQHSSGERYTLNPRHEDDYTALIHQLKKNEQLPDIIAHVWSLTSSDSASDIHVFEQLQDVSYYSLLFLARALEQEAPEHAAHIGVITNNVHDVSGSDRICPEKATVLGPCKVIPQEHRTLSCACIDVVPPATGSRQSQQLVDCLIRELTTETREVVLAFRRGKRWIQTYIPSPLGKDVPGSRSFRERGVYWIIGGLSNVGLLLGRYLAQTFQARLVFSSRSGLPPRNQWKTIPGTSDSSDMIARKIRAVQMLEELGAEVMIAKADVTDEVQMNQLVGQINKRFGQLNGVLYTAAVTSGPSVHRPLIEMGRTETETQFQPKVHGLYVLENVLSTFNKTAIGTQRMSSTGQELDFVLLFSSSSAILGGLGYVTYAAANAFMDAFAISRNPTSPVPWISANWDLWPPVAGSEHDVQSSFDQYAMTPEEGREAFRRVVCLADEGQVVVITGDFQARLDLWLRQAAGKRREDITPHERPALACKYVAPRNKTEQALVDIWARVLGIEEIGVYDNFFELGGHSLLLPQIIAGLRQAFKTELPVRSLFQYTTVAGLSQYIESGGGQTREEEEKSIAGSIRDAFPTERAELIKTYLTRKIALALDLTTEQLPGDGDLTNFDPEKFSVDLMVLLKQDFQIQLFPQEIKRITSIQGMTDLVMREFDRVEDLSRLATTNPLSAYTLQPYRKQSSEHPIHPIKKNKSMAFVLSSPRSGSTIFRVMLAGHPGLFCPPEPYLLHFETMQEWNQHVGFGDMFAWNRQGLEMTFGELQDLDSNACQVYIDTLIEQNESVYGVYGRLQELAAGRILVDKTPTYAMDMEALERAERLFEAPKYIHLIRHPYAVIESFLRVRLDKLLGPNLFKETDVDPYVVAETVWAMCHRQTLQFLTSIEPERHYLVRYEELVNKPAEVMTGVCDFLGVPFDEAVLHPYDNPKERMTGGIGDPNIFRYNDINPERGNAWQKITLPRYLDVSTQKIARELSYELSEEINLPGYEPQQLSTAFYTKEEPLPVNVDDLSDEQVDRMLNELL